LVIVAAGFALRNMASYCVLNWRAFVGIHAAAVVMVFDNPATTTTTTTTTTTATATATTATRAERAVLVAGLILVIAEVEEVALARAASVNVWEAQLPGYAVARVGSQ
jgi:hypothetical protein